MANQAWQVISPGELQLVDLGEPLPKPGDKQILIRLHAAALNYKDRLVVNHDPHYPIATKPRLVPCIDGAGVVEESGPGSAWKKGDRVVVHGTSWITGNDARDFELASCAGAGSVEGTLRRYAVWDDDRVIAAPTGFVHGGSLYALLRGRDRISCFIPRACEVAAGHDGACPRYRGCQLLCNTGLPTLIEN